MDDLDWVAEVAGAKKARRGERIQSLWDGYGELYRVRLLDGDRASVVVKHVRPPAQRKGADMSDRRKRRSYEVERAFYRTYAERCDDTCRVARCFGTRADRDGWMFVLEDLDDSGFAGRQRFVNERQLDLCLAWLASFHARFMNVAPDGLWKIGTYWHLATRPDELARIQDAKLKAAAPLLDEQLNACKWKTLVHGDAKLANFCFGASSVAAVDFQYVGGGCGMKDVAYLLDDDRGLDRYFAHLRAACTMHPVDEIEREWRLLFPVAQADFRRFLAGWSR